MKIEPWGLGFSDLIEISLKSKVINSVQSKFSDLVKCNPVVLGGIIGMVDTPFSDVIKLAIAANIEHEKRKLENYTNPDTYPCIQLDKDWLKWSRIPLPHEELHFQAAKRAIERLNKQLGFKRE